MMRTDQLVNHFFLSVGTVDGYGVFRENRRAAFFANSLGKKGLRRCRKQGKVPVELLHFLKEEGQLKSSYPVPEKSITREEFRKVVENHCITLRVTSDYTLSRDDQRIRRVMAPELNRSFGTQDQVWAAIEWSKHLKGVRRPR